MILHTDERKEKQNNSTQKPVRMYLVRANTRFQLIIIMIVVVAAAVGTDNVKSENE